MNYWSELGVIVLLTLFNGVFTAAEIAMVSVRKTRLQELASGGSRAARSALRLRRSPEALLATVQIGITVIGATTAAFGGTRLALPLTGILTRLGAGSAAPNLALGLVIGGVSYLSLVLGELVPKSLALRAPERFALLIASPLIGVAALSKPLVWLLTASSNLVLRPFKDHTSFSETRLSPEELQLLVEESASAGALHAESAKIASLALQLADRKANALMVPRTKIVSFEVGASESQVLELLQAEPHTRYPVYEGNAERIIGYVLRADVFAAILGKRLAIGSLLRTVSFFPQTTAALDVLRALQASKQQLALLVDEQGGIAGLITIEDIAEYLMGAIMEEHEAPRQLVWQDGDEHTIIALGETPIHEVSRSLDVALPDTTTATTIAGLLTETTGRMPTAGERVMLGPHVEAEVLEATPRQISKLRLRSLRTPQAEDEDDAAVL
jgi:magnesium and cobalt exporter, CNNM family